MKTELPNLLGAVIRDYFTDSPPSRNQSAHHSQLPRQHCPAAAVSCPTTEQADYGTRPDGSRSSRNPRVSVLS